MKATVSAAQSDSESGRASVAESAEETAQHSAETMDSKKALASDQVSAKEMGPMTAKTTVGSTACQMALRSALDSASTKEPK
jgi:hypothetical protein